MCVLAGVARGALSVWNEWLAGWLDEACRLSPRGGGLSASWTPAAILWLGRARLDAKAANDLGHDVHHGGRKGFNDLLRD